ncbi:MAG: hypothetical protein Q9170_005137 [Blastenia crenularia]
MFLPRRKSTVLALACFIAISMWYFNYLEHPLGSLVPYAQQQSSSSQSLEPPPKTPAQAPINGHEEKASQDSPGPPVETSPVTQSIKASERYPVDSFIPIPAGTPITIQKIQHTFGTETQGEKIEREKRLDAVKQSFVHSWEGYKKYAWKKDELAPVRGGHSTTFGGWGATLVDSLDTLWMLGLKEDFEQAIRVVREIDFSTARIDTLNIFETTIRYLGGFLGAYDLSDGKYPVLLDKAKEVGELLYGAFDTPNRMPVTRWDWEEAKKGAKQEASEGCLIAEIGSLTLEFTRLAQLTRDAKFFDAIQRITDVLDEQQNKTALPGLWPVIMDAKRAKFTDVGFTLGGMADSTYEYLPKEHMLLGGLTKQYQKMYEAAMIPIKKHIFFRPMTPQNDDILVSSGVRVNENADVIVPDFKGQHLGCFTGGMVGIGAKIFNRTEDMKTARQLVDGCIWAYNHTQTGIMPEIFNMVPCKDDECKWDEGRWLKAVGIRTDKIERIFEGMTDEQKGKWVAEDQRIPQGFSAISDRTYILRPEAIESVFIFYRITGEKKYQDSAWQMFEAIEKYTRTDIANAAINDVTAAAPLQDDRMESFWLAETLKYFYAIFAAPEVLSLDDYVLRGDKASIALALFSIRKVTKSSLQNQLLSHNRLMVYFSSKLRLNLPLLQTFSIQRRFLIMATKSVDGHKPEAQEASNPVDIYRSHISKLLSPVAGKPAKDIYDRLSWTQTFDKGDLGLAVPSLRIPPKEASNKAAEWGANFPDSDLVEKPVVAGTFIQFFFKPQPLMNLIIPSILKKKTIYGTNSKLGLRNEIAPSEGKKRIIVEFSSPNIAKPFHAGHLRSTIIGGFLANLYEAAGWDVIRMNYLGDWGRQFGLLAYAYELYGDEGKLQKDPIGHLFDIYVEINKISKPEEDEIKEKKQELEQASADGKDVAQIESEIEVLESKSVNEKARQYFKRMEDGDQAALDTWKRFRDLSIERYKKTYSRLNIHYDYYSGESQVEIERMDRAAKKLEESGVSEDSKGAVIVDLTKNPKTKKLGKALVRKKDGSSLYLTRDIGEAVKRYELYKFDKMIYVVASQQDLHLAQLFKILELMGHQDIAEKCQHINFGMVLGMSTRKGTVKFLDDILRDVGDKMHEVMQKNQAKYEQVEDPVRTADTLGITAVMVQDMTGKRINNYEFSLERMTSFEGDTGPYLQYAHARLCSITRKAGLTAEELGTADLSLLPESHAINLARALSSWPDVVQNTLKTQEPVTVLSYLYKMTHMLSSSYDVLKVVGSEPEIKKARMALYEAARQVLNNGMKLLGLSPVERLAIGCKLSVTDASWQ